MSGWAGSNSHLAKTNVQEEGAFLLIEKDSREISKSFLVQIKKWIYKHIDSIAIADWEIIPLIDIILCALMKKKINHALLFYNYVRRLWQFIFKQRNSLNIISNWDPFIVIYEKLILHFISIDDRKRIKKCILNFILISETFEIFTNNYLDFLNLLITGYCEVVDEEIIKKSLDSLDIIKTKTKIYEINAGNLELSIITWSMMIGECKCEENIENLLKLDWDFDEIWYDTIEKLIFKLFKDENYELALSLNNKLKEAYDIQITNFTRSIKNN